MNTISATPPAPQPEAEEENEGGGFLTSLPIILWHRRWLILIPLMLTTIGGLLAAYLMHPVYQSSATILIEAPQVADDLLSLRAPPVNDMISQRVSRARERVLSRMDLIRLIRTYGLYQDEQRTMPLSKIIDKMRADTTIGAVTDGFQMLGNKRGGDGSTIAITVSFNYDDPNKAQVVAQQFVNRFLEVDASTQASQANDAVTFLNEQLAGLTDQITQIDNKVMAMKEQNSTLLVLGQSTGNPDADLSRIDTQISALNADNARLAATPVQPKDDGGLAQAEAQLRIAQAKYSDSHPDVALARAQVETAKRAAAAASAAESGSNPIAAQIAANRTQLAALQNARAMVQSQSSTVSSARARAPLVLSEMQMLDKQADGLREQARAVGTKLQQAQIQARMENEQKGERLTLSDPPVVPDSPIRPNRPALVLGSIVGGLAAGLGLALLLELVMRPIRGINGLKAAIGEQPLALIPDFDQKPSAIARIFERRARRKHVRA